MSEWVDVILVPVEVFGVECHDEDCTEPGCRAFGLVDAVEGWSDCNRAAGFIFRADDDEWKASQLARGYMGKMWERLVRVRVRREDVAKLGPNVHTVIPSLIQEVRGMGFDEQATVLEAAGVDSLADMVDIIRERDSLRDLLRRPGETGFVVTEPHPQPTNPSWIERP